MYLKCHSRFKDGKEHPYYSLSEKVPCAGRRPVERHVLYLGEINDSQKEAWLKCIEAFDVQAQQQTKLALFASDQPVPAARRGVMPCRCGWRSSVFTTLANGEPAGCLPYSGSNYNWRSSGGSVCFPAANQTSWYHLLMVLCAYRLIDPGSEWRLHREWYRKSAMADLLGRGFCAGGQGQPVSVSGQVGRAQAARSSTFLQQRWQDLFGLKFDVLLYDLTSTYFESNPPFPEGDQRQFGYSRDKRSDCVQVVIALVVTPEGFPLAYEVLPGNTSDRTTLRSLPEKD